MNRDIIFSILRRDIVNECINYDVFEKTCEKINSKLTMDEKLNSNLTMDYGKGRISHGISTVFHFASEYKDAHIVELEILKKCLLKEFKPDHYAIKHTESLIRGLELAIQYSSENTSPTQLT
jgi:hypothetical protein